MNRQTQKNNTSGTPGVNWNAKNKNFNASIRISSKTIYLGSFKILEDAIVCRKKAEDKYFGEFANKIETMTNELKDQIEKEALELYPDMPIEDVIGGGFIDTSFSRRMGYIEAGTKYAEKLEEKDKDIEEKDREIEKLKGFLNSRSLECKHQFKQTDSQWKQCSICGTIRPLLEDMVPHQSISVSSSIDHKLAQLKEIAKSMADLITEWCPEKVDYKATTKIKVLTAYVEWCKQNS